MDLILAELKALDKQTRARTKALFGRATGLDPVVDRERIHVSYEGRLLALNVVVRIAGSGRPSHGVRCPS